MFGDEIVKVQRLENGFLVVYEVPDRDAPHDDETRHARVSAATIEEVTIEVRNALAVAPEVAKRRAAYLRRMDAEALERMKSERY